MKIIMTIMFLTFAVANSKVSSANAFASDDNAQKICDTLLNEAIYNCEVSMCEDWLRDADKPVTQKNIEKCLKSGDGDLLEGAQICAYDGGELQSLVDAYNLKHPKNKISCNDD